MSKIKKILISLIISLVIVLICTGVLSLISNNEVLKVPIAIERIEEGETIKRNISYVEIDLKDINKEVLDNILEESELEYYIANKTIEKGELIFKRDGISREDYLIKTKDLEYVSLPIKSATEGVAYKLKQGDKINVYYTAKRKLVDSILKSKIKLYSSSNEETMVTCLLYQNIEVVSLTDNMGRTVNDGTATEILVRLKNDEVLEFANLKDQGVFTYSLI